MAVLTPVPFPLPRLISGLTFSILPFFSVYLLLQFPPPDHFEIVQGSAGGTAFHKQAFQFEQLLLHFHTARIAWCKYQSLVLDAHAHALSFSGTSQGLVASDYAVTGYTDSYRILAIRASYGTTVY